MPAFAVVKHLNVIDDIGAGVVTSRTSFAKNYRTSASERSDREYDQGPGHDVSDSDCYQRGCCGTSGVVVKEYIGADDQLEKSHRTSWNVGDSDWCRRSNC